MAVYLKKFETQAAYEAAESGLILPNVSLTVDNNTVHYNPSTPPTPSHDYVEIGGIKWATMNVGANSVTDYGLYFQWGDTQGYTADQVGSGSGKKYFGWADYKYGTGNRYSEFTKYNGEDYDTLQIEDDAVNAAWGGNWRMPTAYEFLTLSASTTTAWTADYEGSGIAGLVLTSNDDSSKKLFFPAAGSAYEGRLVETSICGGFNSSDTGGEFEDEPANFSFSDGYEWTFCFGKVRDSGYPVRGVLDE